MTSFFFNLLLIIIRLWLIWLDDDNSIYTPVRYAAECNSEDEWLGSFKSLMECALACQATHGCVYFVYGNGLKNKKCYWEKTTKTQNEVCPEGWEEDHYDFYRLNEDAMKGNIDGIDISDK